MSADVLQRLNQDGVLPIEQMADLFNIKEHSCYPYLVDREMRYSHVRQLCRRARDPRIPAAFYNDLMTGTGWVPLHIDADLDFDGDGDVDTDDVIGHAIESLDAMAAFFRQVHTKGGAGGGGGGERPDLAQLAELKQQVLQGIVTAHRAAVQIAANQPKRLKLNGSGVTG